MVAAGRGELTICCCTHRKEDTALLMHLERVARLVPSSLIEFREDILKMVTEVHRATILPWKMGSLTMAARTVPWFS